MKQSEFWNALDQVYGPVLGRSLARDLHLVPLGSTAGEAIESGVEAQRVWECLVEETGRDDAARWVHRQPPKRK